MLQSTSSGICKNRPEREVKYTWGSDSSCQAIFCVTPSNMLALILSHDIVIEITLHKHIRIFRIGAVAATICSGGRAAAVHHPSIQIVQQETRVLFDMAEGPRVRATSDTIHVVGVNRTDPSTQVHSLTKDGLVTHENLSVATDKFCLRRDIDVTVALFVDGAGSGDVLGVNNDKRERCVLAARQAVIDQKGNQLSVIIHGFKVRHDMDNGDTRIYSGRNFISLRADTYAVTIHSPWIDINVDRCQCTRLRRGEQVIDSSKDCLHITQNKMHADFALNPPESTDNLSPSNEPKNDDL